MRRCTFFPTALLAMSLLLTTPSAAMAMVGWVENTSVGATGVACKTNVLNRYSGIDEGYFIALDNTQAVRNDGYRASLAFEIYELQSHAGTFKPYTHIYYDDGATSYTNDEYIWVHPSMTLTAGGTWWYMKIQQRANGSSYWDTYINGQFVEDFWWPYAYNNVGWSAVEVYPEPVRSMTTSDYWFAGRNDEVQMRGANGTTWMWHSPANFPNRFDPGIEYGGPFYVNIQDSWYDFDVRR